MANSFVNNSEQTRVEQQILNGVYSSALGSIGKQALKDVSRLGGLAGVAKTGIRKAAAFTRRRPKTALGVTGAGAYMYGKRQGRKEA